MVYDKSYYGAAVASLEQRIHDADVVVRATFVSAGDGTLTFRAVEYLKGTGSPEFTIRADTAGRSTEWDNREAILFLNTTSAGASDSTAVKNTPASVFEFPDTADTPFNVGGRTTETGTYAGDLPQGYTVDSRNPVWIPATTEGGGAGTGQRMGSSNTPNQNPEFITETRSDQPTASLQDVRNIIAWLEGGTSDVYKECIDLALRHERDNRDAIAAFDWVPGYAEEVELPSGAAGGTSLYYGDWIGEYGGYHITWLEGPDKDLFTTGVDDTDTDYTNGFSPYVSTARPLPAGAYEFVFHLQGWLLRQCDYKTPYVFYPYTVEVVAPENTIHEAFFDPQTIGSGDGYEVSGDLNTGDLSDTDFTMIVGGTDVSIAALTGDASNVVLSLDPYNALAGHTLDFIALDGTTALSLNAESATGDATAGTLTWTVGSKPWSSGDQLMLRITGPPP